MATSEDAPSVQADTEPVHLELEPLNIDDFVTWESHVEPEPQLGMASSEVAERFTHDQSVGTLESSELGVSYNHTSNTDARANERALYPSTPSQDAGRLVPFAPMFLEEPAPEPLRENQPVRIEWSDLDHGVQWIIIYAIINLNGLRPFASVCISALGLSRAQIRQFVKQYAEERHKWMNYVAKVHHNIDNEHIILKTMASTSGTYAQWFMQRRPRLSCDLIAHEAVQKGVQFLRRLGLGAYLRILEGNTNVMTKTFLPLGVEDEIFRDALDARAIERGIKQGWLQGEYVQPLREGLDQGQVHIDVEDKDFDIGQMFSRFTWSDPRAHGRQALTPPVIPKTADEQKTVAGPPVSELKIIAHALRRFMPGKRPKYVAPTLVRTFLEEGRAPEEVRAIKRDGVQAMNVRPNIEDRRAISATAAVPAAQFRIKPRVFRKPSERLISAALPGTGWKKSFQDEIASDSDSDYCGDHGSDVDASGEEEDAQSSEVPPTLPAEMQSRTQTPVPIPVPRASMSRPPTTSCAPAAVKTNSVGHMPPPPKPKGPLPSESLADLLKTRFAKYLREPPVATRKKQNKARSQEVEEIEEAEAEEALLEELEDVAEGQEAKDDDYDPEREKKKKKSTSPKSNEKEIKRRGRSATPQGQSQKQKQVTPTKIVLKTGGSLASQSMRDSRGLFKKGNKVASAA